MFKIANLFKKESGKRTEELEIMLQIFEYLNSNVDKETGLMHISELYSSKYIDEIDSNINELKDRIAKRFEYHSEMMKSIYKEIEEVAESS